ncbi:jg1580, partial [Pararge aegeria aegeria]
FEVQDSLSSSSSNSSRPEIVVQVATATNSAPTSGHNRARKKWTIEMNKFIWRTYLIVSELESKPHYLDLLHKKFTDKFKDFKVSKQRIGDQRRAILRNKLLPQETIDVIRKDVNEELHNKKTQFQLNTAGSTSRIRWTDDINEAIIREYYKITQCESNKTAYRGPLHAAITSQFTQISHVSEQRIADQRRFIVKNNRLAAEKILEIRNEVEHTLIIPTITVNNKKDNENPTTSQLLSTEDNYSAAFTNSNISISNYNSETQQYIYATEDFDSKIQITFENTYDLYRNSNPTQRAFIPKQNTSRKLSHIVGYIDKNILPKYLSIDHDFTTTQTIIYCAA